MDFVAVVTILIVYYIRPQDWVPGLAGANLIQPIAMFAILSVFVRRGALDIRQIIASPIDFLVFLYGIYIVTTAPDSVDTFFTLLPYLIFYFVTRLAIDTPQRLYVYLLWWLGMRLAVAAFAVGSLYGIDVTGAQEVTSKFGGRLALGTWLHNNPNSLGHTVILLLPLAYMAFFWRSLIPKKILAIGMMVLAGYCVYETGSRGSFVAGLIVATFGLCLGRRKLTQVLISVFVVSSATAIFSALPRMQQVSSLRSDEGVQGRMMAWEIARTATRNKTNGDGWLQFEAYIEYEGAMFKKATHSCYVRVAADLGLPGLFIYVGILWCAGRALALLRRAAFEDDDIERCRRMLFVILVGYLVSGWMLDRSYHVNFFLMVAAISAMYKVHRLDPAEESEQEPTESTAAAGMAVGFTERLKPKAVMEEEEEDRPTPIWRRIGLADITAMVVLTYATLAFWDYIMGIV